MMDELGGSRLDSLGNTIRKKRSQSLRRRRPEAQTKALVQLYHDSHDLSPLSSIPVSDDLCRLSDDENVGDTDSKEKLLNLNQCISRCPSSNMSRDSFSVKKNSKNGASVGNATIDDDVDHRHGGPGRDSEITVRGMGSENKLKKVKLKVGDVSHSIQTKQCSNGPSTSGVISSASSAKLFRSSVAPRPRQKLFQDQSSFGKEVPKRDFLKGSLSLVKSSEKQSVKSDTVRKSKRLPKKRDLDGDFDEDDDEIRYLEKLKTSRLENLDGGNRRPEKVCKRSRSEKGVEDTDYEEEENLFSDCDSKEKKMKQKKDVSTSPTEIMKEVALTTRGQRARKSNKYSSGASEIEFPNGLPPPPPRKQKEQLTEVEQQLKKAEAAQRRRMQNEKAARESEAEAIRKILGQDSSRKKREDKIKKRQEELAQLKAAAAEMLASSTIRLVMGPNGTIVTFPQEMGLPELFDTKVRSYPPPREKCVGPLCSNPYKYRDSKSKLPLCSLQCYRAIQSTASYLALSASGNEKHICI